MALDTGLLIENIIMLGIEISPEQVSMFETYATMLQETNRYVNLTAITSPEEVAVKHFADSVSILSVLDTAESSKIIDVGTGAGFPGIPLLIMHPGLQLTLADSTAKKLNFVSNVLDELGLQAEVVHARAEELAHDPDYRERFDFAVSRAVASLNVLSEYTLPFLKIGGTLVAMKGLKAQEELAGAKTALTVLGGEFNKAVDINLTDNAERKLLIINKVKPAPDKYPRHGSQISKKPL